MRLQARGLRACRTWAEPPSPTSRSATSATSMSCVRRSQPSCVRARRRRRSRGWQHRRPATRHRHQQGPRQREQRRRRLISGRRLQRPSGWTTCCWCSRARSLLPTAWRPGARAWCTVPTAGIAQVSCVPRQRCCWTRTTARCKALRLWSRRTGVDLGTSLPTGAARSARRSRKTSRRPYSCSGSTACTKSCTSTPPSLTSPPTSSCFSQTRRCSRDISARFCATRRRSGVTSASCTVCAAVAVMLCAHRSLREVLRGGRGADPHRVAIAGRTPCLCGTTWRRTARASPTRSTPPPRATASCSTSRSTRRPWCCGVPCTSASPCMTAAWPRACRATAAPRPHRPRAPPIPRSTACFPRSTRRGLPPCPVRAQSYPRTSA
eukprot:m.1381364 g.1381364  ORF g.1381364 m.1381364 type:complete len:379 (+) comp24970_c0_seq26:4888-6024(+)